jgi:hypothetical protein
VQGIKTLQES